MNAAERGGMDFLGYHFERYRQGGGLKWRRRKSQDKLKESIRAKTRRGRPGEVRVIIAQINPTLKGWYAYFKYSIASAMARVDEWVRERIRHVLRRRHKRPGMVKGKERTEYPIAWFAEQGLFSLKDAQARWLQSQRATH